MAVTLSCASCFSAAGNAQPAPERKTNIVCQISTPEARSTTISVLTFVMSASGSSAGLGRQITILRRRTARPQSLSSVKLVEPDFNTSRFGALSVTGMVAMPSDSRSRNWPQRKANKSGPMETTGSFHSPAHPSPGKGHALLQLAVRQATKGRVLRSPDRSCV